ncbi:unnamed protein product [Schistosoma mattheei]|uniref:Uncharacterized protein n=1 Tax=Schistosoma mattheei TaxID=31246 RepID=A0A183P6L1_9TREM|nr:unnamed protein product [Schistosoma mattheei]
MEIINSIIFNGETLEDVKSFTYLGSIIDEQEGLDEDVKARVDEERTEFLVEEHVELKTTVNQHRSQNLRCECQQSPTIRSRNLENYHKYHQKCISISKQLSTQNTQCLLTGYHKPQTTVGEKISAST